MSNHLRLDVVDKDGAIREAFDEASATSRASFLKTAVVAGGTLVAGGVLIGGLPKLSIGAPSATQDAKILNFALTLEYLEAAFYTQAEQSGALKGELANFATVVGTHERAHVAFLKDALGSKAVKKPTFDFADTTSDPGKFQATAITLEDTGVAAYNGQAANLTKDTLGAAAMIVSVEARHAAWIRDIASKNPAPAAFDGAKSQKQILAAVKQTGFITG
jgi:Ferritin-like domain